jgi:hypothetical protein
MAKDIKRHISTVVVCRKRGMKFDNKEIIFFMCSLLVSQNKVPTQAQAFTDMITSHTYTKYNNGNLYFAIPIILLSTVC